MLYHVAYYPETKDFTAEYFLYKHGVRYLEKTFEIYRYYPKADLLFAKVYLNLGNNDKAKWHAEKALQGGLSQALAKEAMEILNIDDDKGNQKPN